MCPMGCSEHVLSDAVRSVISRRPRDLPRDSLAGYVMTRCSGIWELDAGSSTLFPLPAGASVAYETGAREASIHQQIWVQEGSIEVRVGSVKHRLAQDDCLAMRLDEPTAFRNRTCKPVRYIVVVTEPARPSRK